MRCPKGHIVELTFDDWRKRQLCPECQKYIGAERNKLPDPNPAAYRVLALDAATGTTGWSIFDNGKLIAYGTFVARQTDEATARIDQVKKWMENICEKCKPDFVGIEDIQFQKNIIIFKTLANLQGELKNALYERGLPFAFTNSSSSIPMPSSIISKRIIDLLVFSSKKISTSPAHVSKVSGRCFSGVGIF